EDVAELLAGPADGRCVDDRQELLEVIAEHAIEEVLVAVLQRDEADVLLERVALAGEILEDARGLLLDRVGGGRKEPLQAEPRGPRARERAALVVHRLGQQM